MSQAKQNISIALTATTSFKLWLKRLLDYTPCPIQHKALAAIDNNRLNPRNRNIIPTNKKYYYIINICKLYLYWLILHNISIIQHQSAIYSNTAISHIRKPKKDKDQQETSNSPPIDKSEISSYDTNQAPTVALHSSVPHQPTRASLTSLI